MHQRDASNIQREMNCLIEVRDIGEELDILEMVLRDQSNTMTDMKKILDEQLPVPWEENRVLVNHRAWIGRMRDINDKTNQAVYLTHFYYPMVTVFKVIPYLMGYCG